MTRKLASIKQIKEVIHHPNADRLDIVTIDGWKTIVERDQYKVDDLVVYFESGSFIPCKPEFEFLSSYCDTKTLSIEDKEITGYRLKTIKLRKEISQGVVIPIDDLKLDITVSIDDDLTEKLEILNYDELIEVHNNEKAKNGRGYSDAKGPFPYFLQKSDQTRIQSLTHYFNIHKDMSFEKTVKKDGTSCTIYKFQGEFGVCSRNLNLKTPEQAEIDRKKRSFSFKPLHLKLWILLKRLFVKEKSNTLQCSCYWNIARKYNLENILPEGLAIQMEIVGPSINGNREKLTEIEGYVYDIYDIVNHVYLSSKHRVKICNVLGLKHIPIIEEKCYPLQKTLDELLQDADNGNQEGFVYKSLSDPSISFKVISNKYLLKHDL